MRLTRYPAAGPGCCSTAPPVHVLRPNQAGPHVQTAPGAEEPGPGAAPCSVGRRALLAAAPLLSLAAAGEASAGAAPPAPPDLGEADGTLNDCREDAISCASSFSDDVRFFYNPWSYEGGRAAAVEALISVATGARYDPGLRRDDLNGTLGISRGDAAAYIVGTTLSTIAGRPPPERPRPRVAAEFRPFDGQLADSHVAEDGSIYVWVTFGLPASADGSPDDDEGSSSSSDDEGEGGAQQQGAGQQATGGTAAAGGGAAAAVEGAALGDAVGEIAGGGFGAAAAAGDDDDDGDDDSSSSSSSSSSSDDEAQAAPTGVQGGQDAAAATPGAKGGGGSGGGGSANGGASPQAAPSAVAAPPARAVARGGAAGPRGDFDPSSVVDAEFVFPPDDAIVNVRAASRVEPGLGAGRLALSFERGVVLERNKAREQLEALRKALRWELVPVLSADDPKFNDERPLLFERLYRPFLTPRGTKQQ